jgi:hypothetical protein
LTGSVPIESIAQAIHERWRREAIANDDTAPTWQHLDESRKESSRDQARRIPTHLHKVGCAIAPLQDRVRDAIFRTSYEHLNGDQWRRSGSVFDWRNRAKPLRPSGAPTAADGDWVIRGPTVRNGQFPPKSLPNGTQNSLRPQTRRRAPDPEGRPTGRYSIETIMLAASGSAALNAS